MSGVTGQLATIKAQADGDAAVVLIDDADRQLLASALSAHAKENGIPVSKIAKEIGVGRTYLYGLIDSNQIELNRLIKIQDYLNINIISEDSLELYITYTKSKLSGRSYDFDWTKQCVWISVSRYYLHKFLLDSMKSQIAQWDFYKTLLKADDQKPVFDHFYGFDRMILTKTIKYCENIIEAVQQEDDDIFTATHKDHMFLIPIEPYCSCWNDIEEMADENIFDHYEDLINDCRNIGDDEIADIYEKEKSSIRKYQDEFFMQRNKKAERTEDCLDQIKKYCSANNRVLRRQSYFPRELEEVASSLEISTIPLKSK